MGVTLSGPLIAVSKKGWQEVGGMIPDSLAPGIAIRAPDKTSARESGDEAEFSNPGVNTATGDERKLSLLL